MSFAFQNLFSLLQNTLNYVCMCFHINNLIYFCLFNKLCYLLDDCHYVLKAIDITILCQLINHSTLNFILQVSSNVFYCYIRVKDFYRGDFGYVFVVNVVNSKKKNAFLKIFEE